MARKLGLDVYLVYDNFIFLENSLIAPGTLLLGAPKCEVIRQKGTANFWLRVKSSEA